MSGSHENARVISNDFQAVLLYSLHTWSDAPALQAIPGQGPYVVLQTGIDPDDLSSTVQEFILGKGGYWTPMTHFYGLDVGLRRKEFIFPGASDVISVMQHLVGKPVIQRDLPADFPAANARADVSFDGAIRDALQHAAPESL